MFGPRKPKPDENTLQAQRLKLEALGRFAGGIAHDFNNILSVIEGYTYVALSQLEKGGLASDDLTRILTATQRGAGITRQLLAFGQQRHDVDMQASLRAVLAEMRILLGPVLGDGIRLSIPLLEKDIHVAASDDQVVQILLNLALNARDAMQGRGQLRILAMPCRRRDEIPNELLMQAVKEGFLRLSVIDTGEGIAPAHQHLIFEPFFTTRPAGKGTGLGLSVVYGLVTQLGGTIKVESYTGKGTAFDVYLPLSAAPAQSGEIRAITHAPSLAGKTVLLAEDEPDLRSILTVMLSNMEMKVLSATNGNEALLIQDQFEGDIDFLLTDIVMPEMDGAQLGELFTIARPQSNVVFMSGYSFHDAIRGRELPAGCDFVNKPLQPDKVRDVLARALARRENRYRRDADKQTSRDADKQTSRDADKQTSRDADKQTSRDADKQTSRDADKTDAPEKTDTLSPSDKDV